MQMTCNLRVVGNCTKSPNVWEISKCYFAVLYAARSQIYIPNFLLQYKKLTLFENKKIKLLKRKPETPCIHFELHFTLNHFLKTKSGENLLDLFNIDGDSISEPVCEQK